MNAIAGTLTMRRFSTRIAHVAVLLTISALIFACDRTDRKPAVPEKVTIAYSATTAAALAEIAQVKGYFLQEGVEVTPILHPYGKPALEDLLAGKADFATVAETPVMFAILRGEKISVISTIQTMDSNSAILARRDSAILTPGDLKGKKIAAILGTTSEFFLDSFLNITGISRKDIEVVNLEAQEMTYALDHGDIDAISIFAPYLAMTQKKLGDRVIVFQDKVIYRSFNIVAQQEFIRKNPETVRKMLRALVKAEEFVRGNPAEAQQIVADFIEIETSIVREFWVDAQFAVTLSQALLLTLEDESRWAINTGLTEAREIPNYLDFIYLDGLKSVKPQAVSILK